MSFMMGLNTSRRCVLAYSILAISVIAALSSMGGVFAQASSTTTATSSSSQTGAGTPSQSSSSGSSVHCPDVGANGGSGTTPAVATACYSAWSSEWG